MKKVMEDPEAPILIDPIAEALTKEGTLNEILNEFSKTPEYMEIVGERDSMPEKQFRQQFQQAFSSFLERPRP